MKCSFLRWEWANVKDILWPLILVEKKDPNKFEEKVKNKEVD